MSERRPRARHRAWHQARSALLVAVLAAAWTTPDPASAWADDQWWLQGASVGPPPLVLDVADTMAVRGRPFFVTGRTEPGIDVLVAVDGAPVRQTRAAADGTFRVQLAATTATVSVQVRSATGRSASESLDIRTVRSRVTLGAYRAAHVSFCGWAADSLREGILELIEDGRINAVQLDLKDEAGHVGYATEVELAHVSGATRADCTIDLADAVDELHAMGVPVIGRIVAFADPIMARWAWDNDQRGMVVQTDERELYIGRYQGFTNFAHPDVIDYNVDVAEEAARLGVDHILWDYIRRPDGSVDGMHFEGLAGTPEDGIVNFTRIADERLAPYGVQHGASVYGIAATRPTQIGQDIPRMADHLDYVAPMVYPTHWGPGELGLAQPVREPYETVYRSLETFADAVDGRRARVVPWLEDSTYRAWDRPFQVAEQVRATYESGIHEWLLWDPAVRYTPDAIGAP